MKSQRNLIIFYTLKVFTSCLESRPIVPDIAQHNCNLNYIPK